MQKEKVEPKKKNTNNQKARVIRGFAPEPLKAHYEEKTSRAECEAACRKDRLSAGQVGRLGVTFNARRSKQMEPRLIRSDVVILNTVYFPPLPSRWEGI